MRAVKVNDKTFWTGRPELKDFKILCGAEELESWLIILWSHHVTRFTLNSHLDKK